MRACILEWHARCPYRRHGVYASFSTWLSSARNILMFVLSFAPLSDVWSSFFFPFFFFFHVVVPAVIKALSYDELRGYTSVGKLRSLIHLFLSDYS